MAYMPFGEILASQKNTNYAVPYLFTSKELDSETGLYYFGARYYDLNEGRWWGVDPLRGRYPNLSVFCYVSNSPITAYDPDGRVIIFIVRNTDGTVKEQLKYRNGNFWHENGKRYNPAKESLCPTMYKVLAVYRKIEASNDAILKKQLKKLETSEKIHYMEAGEPGSGSSVMPYDVKNNDPKKPRGTQTVWDLSEMRKNELKESTGVSFTDYLIVIHEMRHEYDNDIGNMGDAHPVSNAKDPAEIRAVNNENRARSIKRTKYGGEVIDAKKLKNPPSNL